MNYELNCGFLVKLNQNDHTAIIIKSLNMYKSLYIPRSITIKGEEYRIIQISERAFQSSWNPKSITFSTNSELKFISKNAFYLSSLQELSLPKSITTLEEGWCTLTRCLCSLTVPPSIKNMSYVEDSYLIYHSKNETENVLIFVRRDIEYATIPPNIKRIGDSAFENCEKLKSVNFDNNSNGSSTVEIEEIGNNAFAYCKKLENVMFIPESIKRIGRNSFAYCSKLKTLEFPNKSKLRNISSDSFYHSSITELIIPKEIEYLEEGWCRDTNELINIKMHDNNNNNEEMKMINNDILIKLMKTQDSDYSSSTATEINQHHELQNMMNLNASCILLFARRNIEEVTIPSNIKKIANSAFFGCSKLKSVTFSSSQPSVLEEIGENSFYKCSSLEKIEPFPMSLKIIRKSAFDECNNLKCIEFHPDCELEIIERDAFKDSLINDLFLTSKVRFIEEGWCNNLNLLFSLKIDQKNKNYFYINDSFLVDQSKDDKSSSILFARRDIESAIIPSNIKKICKSAFNGCQNLKSLEFEQESSIILEEISEKAFCNCSKLKSIPVFPPSIKKIGELAFSGCKIESISFSSSSILEEICGNVFSSWSLKHILSIPASVKHIGKCAFRSLGRLETVTFASTEESCLVEIDDKCFDYCRELNSVVGIPSSIKRIGHSAFENCVNLREVKFQVTKFNGSSTVEIEEIGNNAFAYCKKLEGVMFIPESIKRIGRNSFAYCSKLKTLEFPNKSKLRNISSDSFFHSSITELIIPKEIEYLEEGWCRDTNELINIKIFDDNNAEMKMINNDILIKLMNTQDYDYISSPITETNQIEMMNYKSENYQIKSNKLNENYILLFARRDIETAIIPSNINRISQCAFQSCSKMKSLVFEPSSTIIEYIGDSAFSYCSSLETVILPTNRIRRIGKFAFFQCKKLKSVFFESPLNVESPEILEEIDEDVFDFCENIEFVSSIPASVKTIGRECFRPLKKITSIELLVNDVYVGNFCFCGCKNLCIASFANAQKVSLGYRAFYEVSPNFLLFINNGCVLDAKNTFIK